MNEATHPTLTEHLLAPPPVVDRYPIVIGQQLSLTYIASAYRLATVGYRQQLVDVLRELLENDPHAYACVQQRVLSVAGARIEVVAAEAPDGQEALAKEIADDVRLQLLAIPSLTQNIATLLWGSFYGVTSAEIAWERTADGWRAVGLSFVHSRRLSYPDPSTWDLYIWDQGQVGPLSYLAPTAAVPYGLRIADFPNKFVVHTPQVVADYPTREGYGRIIGVYMALKRMVVRISAQDFERFIKPWAIGYFKTGENDEKRPADEKDIASLDAAMRALGAGSLASVSLPDSVKVELLKAASTLSKDEFLEYLDAAMAKAALGQTFTIMAGKYGSRSTADTGDIQLAKLLRYEAACLGDTLQRDLAGAIVRLNRPGFAHLTPKIDVLVEEELDPMALMDLAQKGANGGIPVDGRKVGEKTGLPIANPDDPTALPMLPTSTLKGASVAQQGAEDREPEADKVKAEREAEGTATTEEPTPEAA